MIKVYFNLIRITPFKAALFLLFPVLFNVSIIGYSQVTIYPSPSDLSSVEHLTQSTDYNVKVNGNPCFVYETDNYGITENGRRPQTKAAFSYFDFKNVTVTVEVTCNFTANSVTIRPKNDSVTYTRNGNIITFIIREPKYLSIEVNDRKMPLFIFADESEIPDITAQHYFGPGVHNVGTEFQIDANERVYIAGGAVVEGTFKLVGDNIKIRGRGILSAGEWTWQQWKVNNASKAKYSMFSDGGTTNNHYEISGLCLLNAPGWQNYGNYGQYRTIKNTKQISWCGNSDAHHLCGNSTMTHCFIFNNDDQLITNIGDNNTWTDHVIWKGCWGRNMVSMQGNTQKNQLFEDIDVIGDNDNGNQYMIRIADQWNSGLACYKSNYTFRNIRREEPTNAKFLYLNAPDLPDPNTLSISNIYFENITTEIRKTNEGSINQSGDGVIDGVHFKCVYMGGILTGGLDDTHISRIGTVTNIDFENFNCSEKPAAIGNNEITKVIVYPTVTEGIININGIGNIKRIRLFEISGKIVNVWPETNQINIAGITPGIYLLQLSNYCGSVMNYKIVKQ